MIGLLLSFLSVGIFQSWKAELEQIEEHFLNHRNNFLQSGKMKKSPALEEKLCRH